MKSEYTKVERCEKRTTYSLDWNTIVGLESRLLRDFLKEGNITKGRDLLMVSVGVRLGLRVIDNLSLRWEDLMGLEVGEKFIRIAKKTNKERILVMSSKLREVLDKVIEVLHPNPSHYKFSSHLLRKTFVVGSIKKGFENGAHLSLVKVSRLIGHSNVSTTLRYSNFETNQMLNLYELG